MGDVCGWAKSFISWVFFWCWRDKATTKVATLVETRTRKKCVGRLERFSFSLGWRSGEHCLKK